jgi:hypothetical protein
MSSELKIADNHLQLEGINYFRANSSDVQIGDLGEKHTPLTQQNYLSVEGGVPAPKLKVRRVLTLSIDQSTLTEKNLGVTITVPGFGTVTPAAASQQLREDTLKLVKLEMLPADLVDGANHSPKVIDALKRIGNDGRLVHQVILALQNSTATTFSKAVTLDIEGTVAGLQLTAHASGGSSGGTTINLSKSTFAYLLLKPKWDANNKNNWTRIVDWEDDQWSLN